MNGRHHILTLEEALRCIQASSTRLSLQPKSDCVDQIVVLVKSMAMTSQIGFNDHDLEKMSRARAMLPDVPVFWDRITPDSLDRDLEMAAQQHFQALVVYDPVLTQSVVKQIQKAGFEAGAWTVNSPQRLEELIGWGIDRIYTDNPTELIKIIRHRQFQSNSC